MDEEEQPTFEEFCKAYFMTEEQILDTWMESQSVRERGSGTKVAFDLAYLSDMCRGILWKFGGQSSTIIEASHEVLPAKLEELRLEGRVERYDKEEDGVELIFPRTDHVIYPNPDEAGPWYRLLYDEDKLQWVKTSDLFSNDMKVDREYLEAFAGIGAERVLEYLKQNPIEVRQLQQGALILEGIHRALVALDLGIEQIPFKLTKMYIRDDQVGTLIKPEALERIPHKEYVKKHYLNYPPDKVVL